MSHNAPSIYQGMAFDGIRLEFAKGKVVKAEAAGGRRGKKGKKGRR